MNAQTSINNQIKQFKNLSSSKKIAVIASITFIIIAIITTLMYAQKPSYEVLFSQLRGSDPSTVTLKLDELKIKYQIKEESDGTITILVPGKDKAKALVDISANFSPTGGTVGYEILDKVSFGETEKDREQKRKRALEGELAQTLQMLPSINWARVHLDIPEKSILKVSEDDISNSSASVTLSLNSNQDITKSQIKGIVKIVSNAVQDLDPSNVEVIDENMNSLSDGLFGDTANSAYSSDENSKIEKNLEKDLSSKAKRLLETIVGSGNVAVEVDAQMNFDVNEVVENTFGKSVPVSEKTIEKETDINNGSNDLPGSDTNADTEDYTTSDTSQNQSENYSETITNYETEKTTSKTLKSTGEIERLTISVVVNEESLQDDTGVVNQTLKNELLQNAKNAVGYKEDRADEIQFTVVPFNKVVEDKNIFSVVKDLSKPITTIIVVVLGFVLIMFTIKKAYSLLSSSKSIQVISSGGFQDLNNSNSPISSSLDSDDDDDFLDLSQELDINEKRVNKIIDTDPEQVRKVLRQYKKNLE